MRACDGGDHTEEEDIRRQGSLRQALLHCRGRRPSCLGRCPCEQGRLRTVETIGAKEACVEPPSTVETVVVGARAAVHAREGIARWRTTSCAGLAFAIEALQAPAALHGQETSTCPCASRDADGTTTTAGVGLAANRAWTHRCSAVRAPGTGSRRTISTSRYSARCWQRTTSPHRQQAGTFNLLLHDDVRATKAARSIGSAAKQGRYPGGVKIDLSVGMIEGNERLRGSKPSLMPCRTPPASPTIKLR
jgi:hypothetical protein